MGRRGRPPKVKAVLRKPSMSCSSRESSSPDRYEFQSSVGGAPDPASDAPTRVGLSWVTVLKSTPTASMVQVGESSHTGNPNSSSSTVH